MSFEKECDGCTHYKKETNKRFLCDPYCATMQKIKYETEYKGTPLYGIYGLEKKEEKMKIHEINVEDVVKDLNEEGKIYEVIIPFIGSPEQITNSLFFIDGKAITSWPEYVYSVKCGNHIIYNDVPYPMDMSEWKEGKYFEDDWRVAYLYKEMKHA